jgi:hypothetical protein
MGGQGVMGQQLTAAIIAGIIATVVGGLILEHLSGKSPFQQSSAQQQQPAPSRKVWIPQERPSSTAYRCTKMYNGQPTPGWCDRQ